MNKPLGRKAYGSIPHLPNSRLGKGDHSITPEQAEIATKKCRKEDLVIVQDKLDGSNVAIAKLKDSRVVALNRSGYPTETSPYLQHHLFTDWVYAHYSRFDSILKPGEWISGEWLALAHGTKYELNAEPFVAFDIFSDGKRVPYHIFELRLSGQLELPALIHMGEAMSVDAALKVLHNLDDPRYITQDCREGCVWRVETDGKVNFLTKFVRHDKIDGKYLTQDLWNKNLEAWLPDKAIKRLKSAV